MGIGSWPRPRWMLQALHEYLDGRLPEADFQATADDAVQLSLDAQIAAGVDVVTDGEQRRDNYASFVASRLDNCQLVPITDLMPYVEDPEEFERELRALDVPAGKVRHPAVLGPLSRSRPIAVHELEFVKRRTSLPVKVAIPGPTSSRGPCGWSASRTWPTPTGRLCGGRRARPPRGDPLPARFRRGARPARRTGPVGGRVRRGRGREPDLHVRRARRAEGHARGTGLRGGPALAGDTGSAGGAARAPRLPGQLDAGRDRGAARGLPAARRACWLAHRWGRSSWRWPRREPGRWRSSPRSLARSASGWAS